MNDNATYLKCKIFTILYNTDFITIIACKVSIFVTIKIIVLGIIMQFL